MAIFFGIISLAASFLVTFLIFITAKTSDKENAILSAMLGALGFTFFIVGITIIDEYCFPSITPIDVYQGRTTLEITYRDSIPIDSTVVWKEEIK